MLEAPTPPQNTIDDLKTLINQRDITNYRSSSQPVICESHRLCSAPELRPYTPPSSSEQQFPPSMEQSPKCQPPQPLISSATYTRIDNLRRKNSSSTRSDGLDVRIISKKRRYSEVRAGTEQAESDTKSGQHPVRQKAQENDRRDFKMCRLRQTPSLEYKKNIVIAKKLRRNRATKHTSLSQDFSSFRQTNGHLCQHT